jgi:phosphoenolpyruvate-protein phosphotransferase (PTS system enzyme I)
MLTKRGIPVSPGVVCGPALVLGAEDFRIPQRYVGVDAVETEIARFQAALRAVCSEISENEGLATKSLGKQYGAIFAAHLQMVQDPKLVDEIVKLVRERHFSPEFACSRVFRRYAKMFQNLGNRYLADRADDIFDLEKRILRHLLGERREELVHLTEPVVVLAHNLTPGETASLPKQFVLGFATQVGGRTSHTAILAGALEIPAVVGLGDFLSDVSGGEPVIIDGTRGEIIIDPDEETLARYRDSQAKAQTVTDRLQSLREEPSVTRDGVRILLMGNIEFPEEVEHCTERGADGIGLYRTEFLYLRGGPEPTEEDHVTAYRMVASAFEGRDIVIRTLDLGADKFPTAQKNVSSTASASVLGLRSIRLALQNLALFKTQLRAILRAATSGRVAIMFPLVSSLLELRQAKMILEDVKEDLDDEGVAFNRDVPVGMMVEVPSAALMADEFAREVDFFSIGTNDLIQYTLAVDRSDPDVANLYSSGDPSILRLIRRVVDAGRKRNIPVTVCGQMSSDPKFIPLLVGMGIQRLSLTPHSIPEVKAVVRSLEVSQAEEIARRAMAFELARDVENYLRGELKKVCPDLFQ